MTPPTRPFIAADAHGVRPLRHWKAPQVEALRADVDREIAAWASDWAVRTVPEQGRDGKPAVVVSLVDDWSSEVFAASVWRAWPEQDGSAVWWSVAPPSHATGEAPPVPQIAVMDAMCGSAGRPIHATGTIAQQMASEAWDDCQQRLAACFGIAPLTPNQAGCERELPVELVQPWSGALGLGLSFAGMRILLVADPQSMQRWAAMRSPVSPAASAEPRTTLVPITEAVAPCAAQLSVELAPVDIGLGVLANLRLGDVLWTSHRLETPLRVRGRADRAADRGELLCEAFLGQQGDLRAIELLASARHDS